MPEIESCRKCADCCAGCVFIEWDRKTKLYRCLIYKNKKRVPVHSWDVEEETTWAFGKPVELQPRIFVRIEEMFIGEYGICHNYKCYPGYQPIAEEHYYKHRKTLGWRKSRKVRADIPDFKTLVEILNFDEV